MADQVQKPNPAPKATTADEHIAKHWDKHPKAMALLAK